jgi:hypothetical protein
MVTISVMSERTLSQDEVAGARTARDRVHAAAEQLGQPRLAVDRRRASGACDPATDPGVVIEHGPTSVDPVGSGPAPWRAACDRITPRMCSASSGAASARSSRASRAVQTTRHGVRWAALRI